MVLNSQHIIFNNDYLKSIKSALKKEHPSWYLSTERKEYKFGGKIKEDINRLILFETIPAFLKIKSLERLDVGLNFELFF